MGSYRSVLANDGYRTLWSAQVVSALGSRLHAVAFIWLVYQVTDSALTLGVVFAISSLPMAFMSLPAGTLVDRVNRKWVLIASDLVRAAVVPLIPILGRDGPLITVVIAVGVVMSAAGAFFSPARRSIIPNLVPKDEIDAANGLAQMTRVGTQSLYAAGGFIVAIVGPYGAFYLDSVTFVLSAIILLWLPNEACIPDRNIESTSTREKAREVLADAKQGLVYVRDHRVLMPMIGLLVVIAASNAPLSVLMPIYAAQVLDGGSFIFGVVFSAYYVGMFIGGGGVNAVLGTRLTHGQIISWGTVLSGAALALMGLVPPVVPFALVTALVFHALAGFFGIFAQIAGETILQTSAPDETRGKVLAVVSGAMQIAPPLSIVIVSAVMDQYGVIPVLYGIGTVIALTGVATFFTAIYGANPENVAPSAAD